MFYCYVLRSQKNGRYYVGSCSEIAKRLSRHNQGRANVTRSGRPWDLVYEESFETRPEAVRREKQIKSYKGGEAFKKLISI